MAGQRPSPCRFERPVNDEQRPHRRERLVCFVEQPPFSAVRVRTGPAPERPAKRVRMTTHAR